MLLVVVHWRWNLMMLSVSHLCGLLWVLMLWVVELVIRAVSVCVYCAGQNYRRSLPGYRTWARSPSCRPEL